jgi:hypothetical protein
MIELDYYIDKTIYTAVSKNRLVILLGNSCSPDIRKRGYVVGPDAEGRFCHVASCISFFEAELKAARLNEEQSLVPRDPMKAVIQQSITDPTYSIMVYPDTEFKSGAGWHIFLTKNPERHLTIDEVLQQTNNNTTLLEELKGIGNFIAWG